MVDRFKRFDGDANLFSDDTNDADRFVLLRELGGYDAESVFLVSSIPTNIQKKITCGTGSESIVLIDEFGVEVCVSGTQEYINSFFSIQPKHTVEHQEGVELLKEYVPLPGPPGVQGEQGYAGSDGLPGQDGKDGIDGTQGLIGEQGPIGVQGPQGITGPDGQIGEPGQDGTDGTDGIDGQDGLPGHDGSQGQPGQDGQPGEPGQDGIDGLPGKDGIDGKDGQDGLAGDPGPIGLQGPTGLIGPDGLPGRDGKDGQDGMPGPMGTPGPSGTTGMRGATGDVGVASATYPLRFNEDGTLSMDKKFLEQLSKSGGKITMQGGGGNLTGVLSENKSVLKDARHLNFTGSGVTVTKSARGKVDISIPHSEADVDGVGITFSDGKISINHFHSRTSPSVINSGFTARSSDFVVGLQVNAGDGLRVLSDEVEIDLANEAGGLFFESGKLKLLVPKLGGIVHDTDPTSLTYGGIILDQIDGGEF